MHASPLCDANEDQCPQMLRWHINSPCCSGYQCGCEDVKQNDLSWYNPPLSLSSHPLPTRLPPHVPWFVCVCVCVWVCVCVCVCVWEREREREREKERERVCVRACARSRMYVVWTILSFIDIFVFSLITWQSWSSNDTSESHVDLKGHSLRAR